LFSKKATLYPETGDFVAVFGNKCGQAIKGAFPEDCKGLSTLVPENGNFCPETGDFVAENGNKIAFSG